MATRTSRPAAKRRATHASTGATGRRPSFPSFSRGNALTPTVNFVDRDGARWLVYLEAGPAIPALWPNAALIPTRRLRFDSVDQSVVATRAVPAGAPYLREATLQELLDNAQALDEGDAPEVVRMPADRPPRNWASLLASLVQPAALTLILLRDAFISRPRG